MKKFKCIIDKKVEQYFMDPNLESIFYKNRSYSRAHWLELKLLNVISEDILDELLLNDPTISRDDFVEVLDTIDTFKLKFDKLQKDIDNIKWNALNDFKILKLTGTVYRSVQFLITKIDTEIIITKIDNNAEEGINNDLYNHLKNKLINLGKNWEWEIIDVSEDDFEIVYKYYYYDNNFKYNSSTGAGTLTGWLTEKDIEKRANGHVIITLNSSKRLRKG